MARTLSSSWYVLVCNLLALNCDSTSFPCTLPLPSPDVQFVPPWSASVEEKPLSWL